MKKALTLLFVVSMVLFGFNTALTDGYVMEEKSISTTQLDTFKYLQYTPSDQTTKLPLMVYLHGGSGKGDDISKVRSYLFSTMFEDGTYSNVQAYAICPQVPSSKNSWLQISDSVFELIDYMCEHYNIDKRKISLIGHSMGGTGTWALATAHPERFSCIVPMSGSIDNTEANIKALGIMPIWAFVGSADTIVKPETCTEFISSLKSTNTECKLTTFTGATHFDVPELVFKSTDFDIIDWVLSQEQTNNILNYNNNCVGVKVEVPGSYTLIFAHLESGVLQSVASQTYDFSYGRNSKLASVELSKGDKIFMWNSLTSLTPVSRCFIVK